MDRRTFLGGVIGATSLPQPFEFVDGPKLDHADRADPIFGLIEKHLAADDAYGAAAVRCDDVAAVAEWREITDADQAALNAAIGDEVAACGAVLSAVATTTPAGVLAAISWILRIEGHSMPDTCYDLLTAIEQSPALA